MKQLTHWITNLTLIGFLITALVSCSGGDFNLTEKNNDNGKGTVGILLTDKPADPSLFSSINATISRVELLGDDKVTLYSGEPKTVDLLRLRNESIPFTFRDDVPAQTYCKIRLTLDDLELVMTNGETEHPKLSGNGKMDLLIKNCIEVEQDKVITLQLDIDAGNSIHIVENKKGFQFRPVIFLDEINHDFKGKLIRVTGEITKVDAESNSLLLCGSLPTYHSDNAKCTKVHLDEDSAFFDNLNHAGTARPVSELLSEDFVGENVTVIGKYHVNRDDESETTEALTDLVYLIELNAIAVEAGEMLNVEGATVSETDSTGFDMKVSSGPVQVGDLIGVAFQEGDVGINGTRIISKAGDLLTFEDIKIEDAVEVDGVLDIVENIALLNAALVIVDTETSVDKEELTGTVVSVESGAFVIAQDEMACGVAGDIYVTINPDTVFTSIVIDDEGYDIASGGILETGQDVALNGQCVIDGYAANNVVIVEDLRDFE